MTRKRDDFAWVVDLIEGRRREPRADRLGRGAFENVDQILERRAEKKRRMKAMVQLLLQLLPILVIMLLFLLFS